MAKKDTKLENLSKTVHMLIEEIRLSETEGLDRIFMDVYSQQADMMTDSRQQGKVKRRKKFRKKFYWICDSNINVIVV